MKSHAGLSRAGSRQARAGNSWRTVATNLTDARGRFVALCLFVALVGFTGGGSRADIASLILLRPGSILFAGYALILATQDELVRVRGPLMILGALLALTALQLVPLPYEMWSNLPMRREVAEFARLAGLPESTRPLSLDPNRTWNTLFALFAPLAAILLVAVQREGHRVIPVLLGVTVVSIAFAIFQALGARALYLYEVTNMGYPVGLFSNRNHQAILLCWFVLAATWYATERFSARPGRLQPVLASLAAVMLVVLPLLLLTGSRAGLAFSLVALTLSGWIFWRWLGVPRTAGSRRLRLGLLAGAAALIAGIAILLLMLAVSPRDTAFSRLYSGSITELRWLYLPIYLDMARDFLPLGSGFGSFENVFNAYEPASLLSRRYMNQAHNDLLQLIIEGGLPALLILAAGLAWLIRAGLRVWQQRRESARTTAVFLFGSIAIWLGASLFDYPLRTPLGAVLFACLTTLLSLLSKAPSRPLSERTGKRHGARKGGTVMDSTET